MKRILLACFLLTATVTATMSTTPAQASASVSQTAFNTKVSLMDSYIAAGNMTQAQSTWNDIHAMLLLALGDTKASIQSAATPAIAATFTTLLQNQTLIYRQIWTLKVDLATNRVAINTQLMAFSATL